MRGYYHGISFMFDSCIMLKDNRNYSLFNKHILQREINHINIPDIDKKIGILRRWVKNQTIRTMTENELKSDFIRDLFTDVLGYIGVISNENEWTINIEKKTEIDASKPDAILGYYTKDFNINHTQAILELKSYNSNLDEKQNRSGKNYGTPIEQAFSYTSKYDYCKWAIVSNFNEIRLYKVGRSQSYYERFLLEDIIQDTNIFKHFYLLLSKDNLIVENGQSYIEKLSLEADSVEVNITSEFYRKYKQLRVDLIETIQKHNNKISINEVIRCSQKLLDRIIFIRFCEDMLLLSKGRLKQTISKGKTESLRGVWEEIKDLFIALDVGKEKLKINKFNGELFKTDTTLDNLTIPDHFFYKLENILNYDFSSELNINILGRIFEQSISDIEDLKSNLNAIESTSQKSKRRKDGIFYTPDTITKYIVKNTLGKYFEKIYIESLIKANEINIDKRLKAYKDTALDKDELHELLTYTIYRDKLAKVKILDPACGSGAFLVQVFDYLHSEFTRVQDKINKLNPELKGQLSSFDLNKTILSNNIYGVDLNEESIEITKLSLWLKTAETDKPLTALNKTIKCGNSIIDDTTFTNRAFNWADEFPEVFIEGGFDIIVGNPPYIEWYMINPRKPLEKGEYIGVPYTCRLSHKDSQPNLYIFFIVKCIHLMKENGLLGLITSQEWLNNDKFNPLKESLLNNGNVKNIIFDNKYAVFMDIDGTIIGTNSSILFFEKGSDRLNTSLNIPYSEENRFLLSEECSNKPYQINHTSKWNFKNIDPDFYSKIAEKINSLENISLSDKNIFEVFGGFQPPVDKIPLFHLNEEEYRSIPLDERELIFKAIQNANELDRYAICDSSLYWIVANSIENAQLLKIHYPTLFSILDKRIDNKINKDWYKFPNIRNIEKFRNYDVKILVPRSKKYNAFSLDSKEHVFKGTNSAIYVKKLFNIKYILGLLNSSLFTYWYHVKGKDYHGQTRKYEPNNIKIFSIPLPKKEFEQSIISEVSTIISNKNLLTDCVNEFTDWIYLKLNISLQQNNFYNYQFNEFINYYINLNSISPKLLQEIKLNFQTYSFKCNQLITNQLKADRKIDEIVYNMYDLEEWQIQQIQDYIEQLR